MVSHQAIEEEFRKFIGADEGQRTEERTEYRNGTYPRQLKTRVGSLSLNVCLDRDGKSKDELTTYFKPVGRFKPHIESIKLDSILDMAPDLPPEMKELISSMLLCNPNKSQPTKTEISAEFNRIVDGMP